MLSKVSFIRSSWFNKLDTSMAYYFGLVILILSVGCGENQKDKDQIIVQQVEPVSVWAQTFQDGDNERCIPLKEYMAKYLKLDLPLNFQYTVSNIKSTYGCSGSGGHGRRYFLQCKENKMELILADDLETCEKGIKILPQMQQLLKHHDFREILRDSADGKIKTDGGEIKYKSDVE